MLVTFHSKAWSSVTLFGDAAAALLKMAGHSGTVPSALRAADVAAALVRLERELAAAGPEKPSEQSAKSDEQGADTAPVVSLQLRAYPLIQLLSAAAQQGCDVMWEQGSPAV